MAKKYGTFEEQTLIPLKLSIKKTSHRWKETQMTEFSPWNLMWTRTTPTRTLHFNPFVVKSVLESNCKIFRKNGTQQNFNLKPDPQIEKMIFHSVMQLYSAKQSTKTEVFTTSFIYVWTFENQTQVLYASPEVQVLSDFRRPETQIRY